MNQTVSWDKKVFRLLVKWTTWRIITKWSEQNLYHTYIVYNATLGLLHHILHFTVIKSKFVVKLLMQCNESESKVARFVLNLISKSLMIVQSWTKLHLMMILRKQKSSPDQPPIIWQKVFIFFFPRYIWYIMEAFILLLNKKMVSKVTTR